MTDIKHLQDDVAYVRTHVENLERMIAHQIRNDPQARQAAAELFAKTPDLAAVYLAFSEPANQQAIVKGLGLDKSKVSRLVKELVRHDYLRKLSDGSYAWTEFERLLGLSRTAARAKTSSKPGTTREDGEPTEGHSLGADEERSTPFDE